MMIRAFSGAALMLLAISMQSAHAMSSGSAVVETSASKALGVEIARTLNSEALTSQQMRKMFDDTMPKVLAANPDYVRIEAQYPGFTTHVIDAMRPVIERHETRRLPMLWDRLGAVYAANLTEAEMREALAFYRSPTGVWLITKLVEGADMTKMLQQGLADQETKIEAQDLKDAVQTPGRKILTAQMTPQRAKDIMRFGMTPAGRKVRAIGPTLLASAAAWSNESNPDDTREIETAVKTAVQEFIANAQKAKSADADGKPK